jgi:geranyl-CoA carboxylase alpha subunit
LPLGQDGIRRSGHAIEARLCAEDPAGSFRPQSGDVVYWRPQPEAGVRVDSGVEEGGCVSPFYDSMIAKVIAHGSNRAEAVRKLSAALQSMPLLGLTTNQTFLTRLLKSAGFREASLPATALDNMIQTGHELFQNASPSPETIALAAALFANGSKLPLTIELDCGGEEKTIRYRPGACGASILEFDGSLLQFTVESRACPEIIYRADSVHRRAIAVFKDGAMYLSRDGECFIFREKRAAGESKQRDASGLVRAPVAGKIAKLHVQVGETVTAGSTLAIVEAMKMEIGVTSPSNGVVTSLFCVEGGQIGQGGLICEIGKPNSDG